MIKIIREGYDEPKTVNIYTIKCNNCGCVFEASSADFEWRNRGIDPIGGINCPHCKKEIIVNQYTPMRREIINDEDRSE
jgi:transcription elongation factor Elf1